MSSSVLRRRPAMRGAAAAGVLALCAGIQYAQWPLPRTGAFPYPDSGAYALGGQLVLRGLTPYSDFLDGRPPLVFLIDALALGLAGGRLAGLWIASWLALGVAVLLLADTCRRWFGDGPAVLVALSLPATLQPLLDGGNLTETYALPLQAAAIWLAARPSSEGSAPRTAAAVGALVALCFLLRFNLVAAGLAAVAWLALTRRAHRSRVLLAAAAGAALVLAAALAWLHLRGALDGFAAHVLLREPTSFDTLRSRAREGLSTAVDASGPLAPLVWLGFAAALRAALRIRAEGLTPASAPALLVALWLPLELLVVVLSGRPTLHYHYEAPLALAGALALGYGLRLARETLANVAGPQALPSARSAAWVLGLLALATIVVRARRDLQTLDYADVNAYWRAENAAVDAMRRHSEPGATVLVWGYAPGIYLRAAREPVAPFIHSYALLQRGWATPDRVQDFFRRVREARPEVIVDTHHGTALGLAAMLEPGAAPADPYARLAPSSGMVEVAGWVQTHYRPVDEIGPYRWRVYRPRTAER